MGKKVFPTLGEYQSFVTWLKSQGFREMSLNEFRNNFKRLELKAPRHSDGREVGFIFYANNLVVFVWTTYLASQTKFKESDNGWVLIAEHDEAQYFSTPVRRTKNFLSTLGNYAWIARHRALNHPLCPKCSRYMKITKGRWLKSRYWSCSEGHRRESKAWDINMPERAMEFIAEKRRKRQKYLKKRREAGLSTNQAMLGRKTWGKKKPG
jgi:hypothetical protein